MLIGRCTSLPAGLSRPRVAYWPGSKGNEPASGSTLTIARPGATSSHFVMRPLYG